jgi:acyl-CoA dehydrogenase
MSIGKTSWVFRNADNLHYVKRLEGHGNLSRSGKGKPLGKMQMVQDMIAESYTQLTSARLLVLQAAWSMDQRGDHGSKSRTEISMIKHYVPRITLEIIDRAIQIHGALGYTTDMPLEEMYRMGRALRIADGADEVHKQAMAKQIMADVKAVDEWPTEHIPTRRAAAEKRFAGQLKKIGAGT